VNDIPIISVSGLRGKVGRSLTPLVAIQYVAAFTKELADGPIVLTRDGRATGPMLARAVIAALNACGRDVIDANVAATPTTGVLVRQHRAAGGIQISASHNPAEYNGLKLFGADGRVINSQAGQRVLKNYDGGCLPWVEHDRVGTIGSCSDSTAEHARLVLKRVSAEQIRARRFRVLLDSNHGAGSLLGRLLLDELGCQTVLLGAEPDGRFEHPPEPTAENLEDVCHHVRLAGVQVGFCQDFDADRLAIIDEQGRYIGEEYTLALALNHILAKTPGPVVTNCSTSLMSHDIARKYGVPFYRSKVGEAHVCDLMSEVKAVFGGEGNGGPIDPQVGYVRDSFVGMALILDSLATRGLTVSQLVSELPRYEIHKSKCEMQAERVAAAFDRLERHFPDALPDRIDGLRLDWEDRWLLVRASNTEPIVRFVAEARSAEVAGRLCAEAEAICRQT
jgi:phosphomannomutase